jgi:hypothetical protein
MRSTLAAVPFAHQVMTECRDQTRFGGAATRHLPCTGIRAPRPEDDGDARQDILIRLHYSTLHD